MTSFLAWWADHWPLIVALVIYPFYCWFAAEVVTRVSAMLKRVRGFFRRLGLKHWSEEP